MKQTKGYMVSPLDLTERQLLIYRALYSRCNFDTMLVDMTVDQIISEIKIIDLPFMVVYREIKKLQNLGYIELIEKASKGSAPVYKIVNYNEIMCKPKVNQVKTKCKPKHSNSNGLDNVDENQVKTKCKPSANTIKEKEKEKENNNIYSRVVTRLNELASKKFSPKTKTTIGFINARLKEGYVEEDFYKVIDVKVKEWLNDPMMNKFLRPKTLFGTNFESYLNQEQELKEQIQDKPKGKILDFKIGRDAANE